jgi:hypothetical protein
MVRGCRGHFNFINPYSQYRSGSDAHLDWAISPYLSEKLHIGAVGYVYNQLTDDSGASPALGGFRSRVAGIGPQIGFFFPIGAYKAVIPRAACPPNNGVANTYVGVNMRKSVGDFIPVWIPPPRAKLKLGLAAAVAW